MLSMMCPRHSAWEQNVYRCRRMGTNVVPRLARTVTVVALLAVMFDVLVMQHPAGLGLGLAGTLFAVVVLLGEPIFPVAPTPTSKILAAFLAVTSWIPTFRAAPALTF